MTMKTADGVEITEGLQVWDYDLDRVTVDLARQEPWSDYGATERWFYVKTAKGGFKTMSETRVRVRNPFTGEKA